MKNHLRLAILMIGFLWSNPAFTADFNAGLDAAKKGDYAAAFREFEPLAQDGYFAAQNNLGVMYRKGLGVPQDYDQAVKWFTAAAQQGDGSAQLNLSLMYYNGYGVRQDHVKAHMWATTAVLNGRNPEIRDHIATEMTSAQIVESWGLARECVKKEYKGC